jgi:hypothetical protein
MVMFYVLYILGKVFVKWDNGVNLLCNCGYHFKFEVLTADDTDQHNIDDKIEVGCKVRRGKSDKKQTLIYLNKDVLPFLF